MLNQKMIKNLNKEELEEIRKNLVEAWVIQHSDYQEKQLKLVNKEIKQRNCKNIQKIR